jgi:gamma-glutamyltranspeptidase
MLVDGIDFGLGPAASVTAPRFGTAHHLGSFRQTPPRLGSLMLSKEIGEAAGADLEARGHRVEFVSKPLWAPSVVAIDPETRALQAAGDPLAGRHSLAI